MIGHEAITITGMTMDSVTKCIDLENYTEQQKHTEELADRPPAPHSCRNAPNGSMVVARRLGKKHAASAAIANSAAITPYVHRHCRCGNLYRSRVETIRDLSR